MADPEETSPLSGTLETYQGAADRESGDYTADAQLSAADDVFSAIEEKNGKGLIRALQKLKDLL